jgi:hypothetical protein
MNSDWPPPRRLPPGFPLRALDHAGRPISVGAKVRIVSVASCIRELPAEDRQRVKSYEGQIFDVLEIDRYGMVWFGADGGTSVDFSLRPEEVAVVKSD